MDKNPFTDGILKFLCHIAIYTFVGCVGVWLFNDAMIDGKFIWQRLLCRFPAQPETIDCEYYLSLTDKTL